MDATEWKALCDSLTGTQMTFVSYYKYGFAYSGTSPSGAAVAVSIGGNRDDIYRMSLSHTMPFEELEPNHIRVTDPNGGIEVNESNPSSW